MECVLENAHARLDSALKNANHLGEIADFHQKYINSMYSQCMQQPSAAFLQDAINEVQFLRFFFLLVKFPFTNYFVNCRFYQLRSWWFLLGKTE